MGVADNCVHIPAIESVVQYLDVLLNSSRITNRLDRLRACRENADRYDNRAKTVHDEVSRLLGEASRRSRSRRQAVPVAGPVPASSTGAQDRREGDRSSMR